MNEENEWNHRISAGVKEGPADCIRIDEGVAALKKDETRDYFDATASNWNTSAHRAPWRVSLYKDRQSNRRLGVF